MSDDELRAIARNAVETRVYSGNVKALRAVYEAGYRAGRQEASRLAKGYQSLVEVARRVPVPKEAD